MAAAFHDLLVLNAEIAALVRASIPLELGLRRLSVQETGRLGRLAERVAVRLESGASLVEALRQEGKVVSPLYAAVVEAGLRSDRLPDALEGLVDMGRVIETVRRRVSLSLMYPLVVVVFAYLLLSVFAAVALPAIVQGWDPKSPLRDSVLPFLMTVQETAVWWVPGTPLVVVALAFGVTTACRKWGESRSLPASPSLHGIRSGLWIPGVGRLFADLDRSHVCRVLGLLLEHQIPLPEALRLTARTTESPPLGHSLDQMAAGLEQGRSLLAEVHVARQLPTLLSQLLRAGAADADLPAALNQAAEIYRRRALRRVDWLRATLTPALTVFLGGTVTLVYALCFVMPLVWFYRELLGPSLGK
uniref:Type II secretion system protein GspF domain-containing protein n=1 Tax=Schlesneria paludicola TaxID=360056 RepID=A0A7C2NT03_9PLAN